VISTRKEKQVLHRSLQSQWGRLIRMAVYYLLLQKDSSRSVSQKSSTPKTFCNIFTRAKYISVKFWQSFANLYPHTFARRGSWGVI